MAVSELCGNAIDHCRNDLGAYPAVMRVTEPRKMVSLAISDLGLGVPEHIRQRYPEWSDDGWAIAHATDERVTGTNDPHRGFGFSSVFESALTRSLHSAKMDLSRRMASVGSRRSKNSARWRYSRPPASGAGPGLPTI